MKALNTYSYHGQPRHTVWEVAIIITIAKKESGVDYIRLKRSKKKPPVIVPNKYSLTITSLSIYLFSYSSTLLGAALSKLVLTDLRSVTYWLVPSRLAVSYYAITGTKAPPLFPKVNFFYLLSLPTTDLSLTTQTRFSSNLTILNTHKQTTDKLCLVALADRFVAELSRAKRASGAPWMRKWSNLPIRENLVITWPYTDRPPDRPSVRTTGIPMSKNSINRYGNPNATRGYFGGNSHSHQRLVKQRQEKSQKRRKRKAEIVSVPVLSKVLRSCQQIWNIEL